MYKRQGLNWNVKDVVGVVCTHKHLDHSKSVKDFEAMGIPVFAPYRSLKPMIIGDYRLKMNLRATSLNGTSEK